MTDETIGHWRESDRAGGEHEALPQGWFKQQASIYSIQKPPRGPSNQLQSITDYNGKQAASCYCDDA